MPYLRSNIPSKIFYLTYASEILRTIRTITRSYKQGGQIKAFPTHWLKVLEGIFKQVFPNFLQFYRTIKKTIAIELFYNLMVSWNRPFLNNFSELIHLMAFWTSGWQIAGTVKHV